MNQQKIITQQKNLTTLNQMQTQQQNNTIEDIQMSQQITEQMVQDQYEVQQTEQAQIEQQQKEEESVQQTNEQNNDIEIIDGNKLETNVNVQVDSFDDLNLHPDILRGIYGFGWEHLSNIQSLGILPIIKGKDVLAQAQSGTGKTGTFSIGILQRIDPQIDATQALILAPVRELAKQIARVIKCLGEHANVKVHCSIGGTKRFAERKALQQNPHIVVGTPGRVLDMMEKGWLKTDNLQILCCDEADEVFDHGFQESIDEIFKLLPGGIQILLFSATLPKDVLELSQQFLNDPARILVKKEDLTLEGIKQFYVPIQKVEWKFDTLCELFSNLEIAQCMIYCNKKDDVEALAKAMIEKDFVVTYMHSGIEQDERDRIMYEFRTASARVLISTDLLARGIDVQQVQLVINYDLPFKKQNYIHRIGRSGRFGRKGTAINLVTQQDATYLSAIEKHYDTEIKELPVDVTDLLA